MTYQWANTIFEKKLVVKKTGVTKYSIKKRLQLDHHHTRIPKRLVYVCLSSFFLILNGLSSFRQSFDNFLSTYLKFILILSTFRLKNEIKVGFTDIDRPRVDH